MLFDFERIPQPQLGKGATGDAAHGRKTRRNDFEMNYERLEALLGRPLDSLKVGEYFKLTAPGFMDLTVEVVDRCDSTKGAMVSLCHYYELNGDLCQDPEIVVRVLPPGRVCKEVPCSAMDDDGKPKHGRIEPTMFQQAIPPIYQQVYDWSSGKPVGNMRLRDSIHEFLTFWLRNLKSQGHEVTRFNES